MHTKHRTTIYADCNGKKTTRTIEIILPENFDTASVPMWGGVDIDVVAGKNVLIPGITGILADYERFGDMKTVKATVILPNSTIYIRTQQASFEVGSEIWLNALGEATNDVDKVQFIGYCLGSVVEAKSAYLRNDKTYEIFNAVLVDYRGTANSSNIESTFPIYLKGPHPDYSTNTPYSYGDALPIADRQTIPLANIANRVATLFAGATLTTNVDTYAELFVDIQSFPDEYVYLDTKIQIANILQPSGPDWSRLRVSVLFGVDVMSEIKQDGSNADWEEIGNIIHIKGWFYVDKNLNKLTAT